MATSCTCADPAMAMFGGLRKEEAQDLLVSATIKQDFPGANIREMQAFISYPCTVLR